VERFDKETKNAGKRKMALEHEALTERQNIHFAVVRSQLRAVDRRHGLLLNFAKTTLEPKRVIAA